MALLTQEQSLIRDQARSWATQEWPVARFRALRDSGDPLHFEPATWRGMVELGWTGILIPEAHGLSLIHI